MPTWTINGQTIAALNGADVVRELRNMDVDRVTFSRSVAADAADLFAYDSDVAILKDGLPWFRGRSGREPAQGDPSSEGKSIEILGPWEQLFRLTYQQRWMGGSWVVPPGGDPDDPDWVPGWQYRSRLILGQSESGTAQTVGAIIREIIAYAASCGVTVSAGTIADGPYIPWEDVCDITCADAIRRVARWIPEAVGYFDYSTATPTFNFRLVGDLPVVSLAVGDKIQNLNLTRMGARSVPAVVLKYETSEDVDGTMYRGMVTDAYPVGATGAEIGAVVQTLQLAGSVVSTQRQHITSVAMPNLFNAPQNKAAVLAWFLKKNPSYAADPANPVALDPRFENFDFTWAHNGWFDYELLEGSIQDWMRLYVPSPNDPEGPRILNPDRVYSQHDIQTVVTFKLTYALLDQVGNKVKVVENETVTVRVTTTDAQTGWYVKRSNTYGEQPPSGLAEALYNALNAVHYAGSISLMEEECSGTVGMGKRLAVTGGAAAWASARMIVQGISESLDTGTTQISVGPPAHLTPNDILAIRYSNRNRRPADFFETRTGGQDSARQIDQSSAYPKTLIDQSPGHWGDRIVALVVEGGQVVKRTLRVMYAEDDASAVGATVTVQTGTRFDSSSNQLQIKTQTAQVLSLGAETDWVMIDGGQADDCAGV